MTGMKIGFALTGSHCTFAAVVEPMKELVERGFRLIPIFSAAAAETSTRFGQAGDWRETFESICREKAVTSIRGAEEAVTNKLDAVVVAPCTGGTLAKLANAISDTPVTMAVKAVLRNDKPVVLAIATNDGLGGSGANIGRLLDKKGVFFVPFGQDNPLEKPRSLVCRFVLLPDTLEEALAGKQIQPILAR